ncbi:bifunctional protein-serine/threonine kinase/phosphatase [Tolumonas lignilytica]|uniref:bifunctional protein-serine/threonine kinase/phosphatase n=1 Tax=Tolumonas lignilytica TaxID=1283284 RepID=UPI000466FD19|nr:bifunctional protein-serine/threonine kinase/phosphatase [Tolumonas lignilytica]
MAKSLKVRVGGYSIAGQKSINQDAFAVKIPDGCELEQKGGVAVIADGVSSCEDSHIASQTAVTSFINDYLSTSPSWSVSTSASKVISSLNRWLYQKNQQNHGIKDSMLTTFSAAVVKSATLHIFHVGDSRIYLYSQQQLEKLTTDHVATSGKRTHLTRALGADSHLEVDYLKRVLNEGDRIILTSDGVHGVLTSATMKEILFRAQDPEAQAKALVDLALYQGSEDNLTVLVLAVDSLPNETLDETQQRLTQLPIPPVLLIGNKIDGYEVLDIIFNGTRSHMYQVRDTESGALFVLKAPSEYFTEDLLYLDGFIREEWVGQTIDHPNVMKTYKPLRPKQFMYYLGEYIVGCDLRTWMNEHPAPDLTTVRDITKQIIAGLRAFQRNDMVHQDLKPENIMLTPEGKVKILDFGTVLVAGSQEMNSPLDKSIPQGSVNYIAPEYLMGVSGTMRSDLFSLAVIVYEMLTGKLPYKERSPRAGKLKSYAELTYTPAKYFRPDLPVWVDAALQKALQPVPENRYEAFSEFLTDISAPNRELEAGLQHRPILEENPLLFWKFTALILLLGNLMQLFYRIFHSG